MKVSTRIVIDIASGAVLEHEWFEYPDHLPVAKCDRSAQAQAGTAEKNAGNVAANEGANAAGINSTLTPFLTNELNNPSGYGQQGESAMLSSAVGGAGGATSGITGQANLQAARTRNAGGYGSALDAAARARSQAGAQASEGVAANNADLQQSQKQDAARGLQGLYGTDTSAMLGAMGNQTENINAETAAGDSGWLQNMTGILSSVGNLGRGVGSAMQGFSQFQNSGGFNGGGGS